MSRPSGCQIPVLPFSFTGKTHLSQYPCCLGQASVKDMETSLVFQMGDPIMELDAYGILGKSKEAVARENCGWLWGGDDRQKVQEATATILLSKTPKQAQQDLPAKLLPPFCDTGTRMPPLAHASVRGCLGQEIQQGVRMITR